MRQFLEAKGAKRCMGAAPDRDSDLCDAAARGDVARLRRLTGPGGIHIDQGDYDRRAT